MQPQTPHEKDQADELVMTGDGVERRDGPRPTMTAQGAVIEGEDDNDRVMTGDGAEPRDTAKPRMTADGARVADDDEPRDS